MKFGFASEESRDKPELTWKICLIWLLMMAAGTIFFFTGNTHEGVWYDEAYTFFVTYRFPNEIIHLIAGDSHPPLYFIGLWAFRALFGNSLFVLRGFSAIGALALAALGMGPVRRLFGVKTGLIYTFLIIVTPATFFMSQEMRNYTWGAFFTAGAALYFFLAVRNNVLKEWVMAGIFGIACAYTHYCALIVVMVVNILLFIFIFLKKKDRLFPFILVNGIIALIFIPWIIYYAYSVGITKVRHDWKFSLIHTVSESIFYPFGFKFGMPDALTALPVLVLACVLIIMAIVNGAKAKDQNNIFRIISFTAYWIMLLVITFVSLFFNIGMAPRYLFLSIGLFILPLASGFSSLKMLEFSRPAMAAGEWLFIGLFMYPLLLLPQIISIQTNYFNGPIQESVDYIKGRIQKNDIFIDADEICSGSYAYYFPEHQHYIYRNKNLKFYSNMEAYEPVIHLLSDPGPLLKTGNRIWLIGLMSMHFKPIVDNWIKTDYFQVISNISTNFENYRYSWIDPYVILVEKGKGTNRQLNPGGVNGK